MKKRISMFTAVLMSGLLLFCPESYAVDTDILPSAGFAEFVDEIEVEPELNEIETYEEAIEPTYILSDYEADLLLRIGVLEGGETDVDGIAHVMQVVLNRVESDRFPDTIDGVIFQTNPTQFTTASRLASANITPEAYVALDAVIFGEYKHNDCHFFESCDGLIFSSWANYSFSYGGHDFYKVKGA